MNLWLAKIKWYFKRNFHIITTWLTQNVRLVVVNNFTRRMGKWMCYSTRQPCWNELKRNETYRIPDLKFYLFAINCYHASSKLQANGEIMHGLETLVCELEQQTRLPHAGVPNNNVFEQECVRHGSKMLAECECNTICTISRACGCVVFQGTKREFAGEARTFSQQIVGHGLRRPIRTFYGVCVSFIAHIRGKIVFSSRSFSSKLARPYPFLICAKLRRTARTIFGFALRYAGHLGVYAGGKRSSGEFVREERTQNTRLWR